jgi:hypothetical protein
MTAVACLRVVIDAEAAPVPPAMLGPIVEKLTKAYLETRWSWPREFVALTHYAFLLTDPRANELDVRELLALSEELQLKFFGHDKGGRVALLLFEGSEAAVRDFARLEGEDLARARRDPEWLPAGGRLAQILGEDLVSEMSAAAPAPPEAGQDGPAVVPRLHGIYFSLRNVFIGDVISSQAEGVRDRQTLVEGADRLPRDTEPFDAGCIEAAIELLGDERVRSSLYVPLSYDSLVRPSLRAAVSARISQLPETRRAQLAALVYNVPRDPPFGAMTQIRATLGAAFNTIDLRVDDPDFEIDKLATQAVAGVSFALPQGDRRTRMAALRHFTQHRAAYKQRRIWASVTNVRDAEELEACQALGVPFVTGPAVCDAQPRPMGGRVVTLDHLPIRSLS